ncbi:hypothetical protein [Actinomadura sp. BRA 177]|uniref:hypothetical protein n=1 Tax=Actinomadura sp. BRA 177 TaxID=2745202 RepID=UPI001595B998|nr:hypothetical protein [Actinomadura sp. BRA 177]NVI90100.1 hypothetical protein [Actinomadura sp. BRA 177]
MRSALGGTRAASRRRLVDACDTAAGLVHLARGDVPRGPMAALVTITGTYAALDVLSVGTSNASAVRAE